MASDAIRFVPGVPDALGPFMEPVRRSDFYARYDFGYLRWQITDSPHLTAETCIYGADSNPRAAAR